jgi:hypothetical protein
MILNLEGLEGKTQKYEQNLGGRELRGESSLDPDSYDIPIWEPFTLLVKVPLPGNYISPMPAVQGSKSASNPHASIATIRLTK